MRHLFFDPDPAADTPDGADRFRDAEALNTALRTLRPGSHVELTLVVREVPLRVYRTEHTRYRVNFDTKFAVTVDESDPLWLVVESAAHVLN